MSKTLKNHKKLNPEISGEFLVDPSHPETFHSPKANGHYNLATMSREVAENLVRVGHPGITKIIQKADPVPL